MPGWGSNQWGAASWGDGASPTVVRGLFWDAVVVVNGYDISHYVTSVKVEMTCSPIEITLVGDTHRRWAPGLWSDQFSISYLDDYGAASPGSVLQSVLRNPSFTVTCKPSRAAISPTNPMFSAACMLENCDTGLAVGAAAGGSAVFSAVEPMDVLVS